MYKSLEEAYQVLIPYCYEPENPLFDFGCVILLNEKDGGELKSSLLQSYHEDIESIDMMRPFTEEKHLILNEELRAIFEFLQKETQKLNPDVLWDELHFYINSDQSLEVAYLFDGEGVDPISTPPPRELTFEYLASLMFENLKFHAPENFGLVWEELTRKIDDDGKTSYKSDFYYSFYENGDDKHFLRPKDTIFMVNATEKLFDEFPKHDTIDWSKLMLFFTNDGELKYVVLENNFN